MGIIIIDSFKNKVFDPNSIAGMDLWLDASDSSTINAGSPTDLDAVSTWVDKSSYGNDATQGTLINQPIWNASGSVSFVNPTQLVIADNTLSTDTTWFLVMDPVNTAGQVLYLNTGTDRVSITSGGVLFRKGTVNYSDGQPKAVAKMVIDGYIEQTAPTVTAWKDKVASMSGASNLFNGGAGFVISGRSGSPANDAYTGDILEVIRYNNKISTIDRQNVENYLSTKHGTP